MALRFSRLVAQTSPARGILLVVQTVPRSILRACRYTRMSSGNVLYGYGREDM